MGISGPEGGGLLILLAVEDQEIRLKWGTAWKVCWPTAKSALAYWMMLSFPILPRGFFQRLAGGTKAFARRFPAKATAVGVQESDVTGFIIFLIIAIIRSLSAEKVSPSGPGAGGPLSPGEGQCAVHLTSRPMPPVFRAPKEGGGGGFEYFGGGRSGGGRCKP